MLNIEDFENEKPKVEDKLQKHVEKIKQNLEKEFEERKKQIFEEGYQKGYKQAQEELIKQIELEKSNLVEKFEQEKQLLIKENNLLIKSEIEKTLKDVEYQLKEFKEHLTDVLLDSVEEILEILFISPTNAEFLKEKIKELISANFEEEKIIKIIVDEQLAEYFKDTGYKVETGNLDKGTFIIRFDGFSLESKLKEKMETIKNEIKREIKENT